jgi:hypothetical protein
MATLYDALRQLQNDRIEEARNYVSTGGYVEVTWENGLTTTHCWDEDLMDTYVVMRKKGVGLENVSSSCN